MKPFGSECKFVSGSEKVNFIESQRLDRKFAVFPIQNKFGACTETYSPQKMNKSKN
jgi:hypothetical protein